MLLLGATLCACEETPKPAPQSGLRLTLQRRRALVAEQMFAAIEMQHSGEPLAEAMGRALDGFDANALVPDRYTDPESGAERVDLPGYSSAVESYQYSKFMMNMLSFETGAGLSLMYGPVLNPAKQSGVAAVALLRGRVQALAQASRAGVDPSGPWVQVPPPADNAQNPLGFPGLWPVFAELRSFDPRIAPAKDVTRACALSGGYGASAGTQVLVGTYECGYGSLHLLDREAQVEKVLSPDALGLSAWKQALWVINYLQFVHDAAGTALTDVDPGDSAKVGRLGNTVVAKDSEGAAGEPGTWIGASDLEGFQGMLMAEEIDNKAALLLGSLLTGDGRTLAGFATLSAALAYDYQSPLRLFPHEVAVQEQAEAGLGVLPRPTQFMLQSGESRLWDLAALLGAYSHAFALTDRRNLSVGGSPTNAPVFDGDPFPADNGRADGEATLHDRALALLKVALVTLDRAHVDPQRGVLVDSASLTGTPATLLRERKVSTVALVQGLLALRTSYRALTAQLTLYGNTTPDRLTLLTPLDDTSTAGIPGGVALASRLRALLKAQADFLATRLVDKDGLAVNGYDLDRDAADPGEPLLEAQSAALRGLLAAYLATSDVAYRARAEAALAALQARYYSPRLRAYKDRLNSDETYLRYTPLRFASLQGALREAYQQLALRPGQEALKTTLEERLGRLNKLVLNGWDDQNGDGQVDYPRECARVEGGLPRGGLMLAERALTGELGSQEGALTADRDRDCVPQISDVGLPAMLAAEIRLDRPAGTR